MPKLYQVPDGYYDLPFTWAYDAANLTDGQDYLNQFIYIQGGYGEFIMRRAVGFSRVLELPGSPSPPAGGMFRLYDGQGIPLASDPIFTESAPTGFGHPNPLTMDIGFPHEVHYPETGKIKFDLYRILKGGVNPLPSSAQLAFQGVRRMKGQLQKLPQYRARPKTYTYNKDVLIPTVAGAGQDIIMRQPIKDYDFELYQIIILVGNGGLAFGGGEATAFMLFSAVAAPFSLEIINTGLPNEPFQFVVVPGVSVTITLPTDAAGGLDPTPGAGALADDVIAAWNANADAVAMGNISGAPGNFFTPTIAATVVTPLVAGAALGADSYAALWIRDKNRIAISNIPVLDLYCDGCPTGAYRDGAVVPPLYYPKDTLLQIDFRSTIDDAAKVPALLKILMVGKQYIPC